MPERNDDGVTLSPYERKVLEEVDRELRGSDPVLHRVLNGRRRQRRAFWIAAAVVGLVTMFVGLAAHQTPLAFVGFVGFVVLTVSTYAVSTTYDTEAVSRRILHWAGLGSQSPPR